MVLQLQCAAESPGGWAHPRVPGLAGPRRDQESAFLTDSQALLLLLPLGGGLDLQNHSDSVHFQQGGVALKEVKSGFWEALTKQIRIQYKNKSTEYPCIEISWMRITDLSQPLTWC